MHDLSSLPTIQTVLPSHRLSFSHMERPRLEVFHHSERFSDIRLLICTNAKPDSLASSPDSFSQPDSPHSYPLSNWALPDAAVPKVFLSSLHKDSPRHSLALELPAHKLVLAAASDFFAQLMEIQDPKQITLQVAPCQVEAAKALTHHMYHGRLPSHLTPSDVATVLQLADRYQMVGCVEDCRNYLCDAMANVKGGQNIAPVLEVCSLLTLLGLSSATEGLFAFFKTHKQMLQRSLSALKEKAAGRPPSNEGESLYPRAVAQLQVMFKDMERVWVQSVFQDVLAVFPIQVVQAVLSWDDLCVRSENIVVMAAHFWLQAQDRLAKHDAQALLNVIRIPYCTFSFLQGMLPNIIWARKCRDFDERLKYGAFAAAAPGRYLGAFSKKMVPAAFRNMMAPRCGEQSRSLVELEWELPVKDIIQARERLQRNHNCREILGGSAAWCNGFRCVPAVAVCAHPEKSPHGCVLWGGIQLAVDKKDKGFKSHGTHDQWPAVCLNLGRLTFSLVDPSESLQVWVKNFGDRVDVLGGNEILGGGLWKTFPEDVAELVKRGCVLHCSVQVIDME